MRTYLLAIGVTCFALCCVAAPEPTDLADLIAYKLPAPTSDNSSDFFLEKGLRELSKDRFAKALTEFERGLGLDPQNAHLHFLVGYCHHLSGARGNNDIENLAQTGYQLAIKFDSGHWLAAYQLGKLHYEANRFLEAQNEFARAVRMAPDRDATKYALAVSSYGAGDPISALSALQSMSEAGRSKRDAVRAAALSHAALGQREEALKLVETFASATTSTRDRDLVRARVDKWHQARARLTNFTPASATKHNAAADSAAEVEPEETKMVILDVVIIRHEEVKSKSSGVNLLRGLEATLDGDFITFNKERKRNLLSGATTSYSETIGSDLSIGVGNSVAYNLNIANSSGSQSQLLARPSLIAYEHKSSSLSLGQELIFNASGQFGKKESHEVGLKLEFTPTFNKDGTLMLSGEVSFSAFEEQAPPGSFNEAVATSESKSKFNVQMPFDKTLIIGGGTQSVATDVSNEVPVLGRLPGIQYLFSERQKSSNETKVLILVTPHRPQEVEPTARGAAHLKENLERKGLDITSTQLSYLQQEYKTFWHPTSNLYSAMHGLTNTPLYHEFRRGDLQFVDIDRPPAEARGKLRRSEPIIRQLLSLMYF